MNENNGDSAKASEETFGVPELDKVLEEGLLKGHAHMDLALLLSGVFLTLALGLFPFMSAPSLPFVFEDFQRIVENEALHNLTTISEGWDAAKLRPVVALSYAIDWKLGGGSPALFHATNVLIHLLCGAMVFVFCRVFFAGRVSEAACLAGSLLFLFYPDATNMAFYIARRGELLGVLFGLIALTAYMKGRGKREPDATGIALGLVAFTLAWGSHPVAWMLPVAMLLAEAAARGRGTFPWLRLAPFVFLGAAFVVAHVATFKTFDAILPDFATLSGAGGTLTAPGFAYLVSVAIALVVSRILSMLPKGAPRVAGGLTVAVALLYLGTADYARTGLWRDEQGLLLAAKEREPDNRALDARLSDIHVGAAHAAQSPDAAADAYARAVPHLELILESDPGNAVRWLELGDARRQLGNSDGARDAYDRARRADPWNGLASARLAASFAATWRKTGDGDDLRAALDLYAHALEQEALSEGGAAQYAALLTRTGNFEAADAVLSANPEWTNLERLRQQNQTSIDALSKRQARIETLEGREKTYEQAYLHHLRTDYLRSNYLLQADLAEGGFDEKAWLLLGDNKRLMKQLDGFVEEYKSDDDIPAESWKTLAENFHKAGDSESAERLLAATSHSRTTP